MKQRLAALPLRWKFLLLPATAAVLMLLLWAVYLHERRDADQRLDLITDRYLPLMRELAQVQNIVHGEHVRVVGVLAGRLRGEYSPPALYREGRRSVEVLHEAEVALRALPAMLPPNGAASEPLEPVLQALAAYRNEVAETVLQGSVQAELVALHLKELSAAFALVTQTQAELTRQVQGRLGTEAEALMLRRQTAYGHAMVMIAAALALLLALSLWLSHLFADDLRALVAALARLRDGQTDTGTEQLATRRDEFGALHGLVQAFRGALVQRDQAERALADEAQDLERRVRERTEALERARLEAERANHAKSEFLSRMSHELRTPLNAILGFGQLMQMQAGDDVQRHRLREILHAGRHLLTLIDEVLDLARVESGHLIVSPEPVALRVLAADCITLVRPAAISRGVALL
jgi:signal transduction histidine kinase